MLECPLTRTPRRELSYRTYSLRKKSRLSGEAFERRFAAEEHRFMVAENHAPKNQKGSPKGACINWRKGRDLNPRYLDSRQNGFRDRRIQPLCHPSKFRFSQLNASRSLSKENALASASGKDFGARFGLTHSSYRVLATRQKAWDSLAERWGFEPQIPFWGIHDFQSCSLSQTRTSLQLLRVKQVLHVR